MKPIKAKNLLAGMWIAVNYGTAIRCLKICELGTIEYDDGAKLIEIKAHDDNDCKHCVAVSPPEAVHLAGNEGPED
jgi:heterodisulfide reductase subunit A-like polyferredoxin